MKTIPFDVHKMDYQKIELGKSALDLWTYDNLNGFFQQQDTTLNAQQYICLILKILELSCPQSCKSTWDDE